VEVLIGIFGLAVGILSVPIDHEVLIATGTVSRAAAILKAFSSIAEVLELRTIAERSNLNKSSAFRILETLVESGLLERVGKRGYRSQMQSICTKRFRLGYASQSNLLPFTSIVTEGLIRAASAVNIELLVLSNKFSPQIALRNADRFVAEKVDLVIDSQINLSVADQIASKFSRVDLPFIAVDIPHPGAIYFGADNYRAGKMAGRNLARWNIAHWNGGAKRILFLEAEVAGPVLNSRLTGMFDGMCEVLPQIKKLPIDRFDTKGGQFEATLNIVRRHLRRGLFKKVLVCSVNDTTALATLQAFREFGMEDECAIAGKDASFEARKEMRRSGSRLVCSTAYFPENYGNRLVELALNVLNRKSVTSAVFTEHQLVTPENVNTIYPNDSWEN